MVSFEASRLEYTFASRIAKRAVELCGGDYMQTEMDIIACHLNGCPLNLEALLHAEAGDFHHDIAGIRRHIDRTTGQLGGCFVPRFSDDEFQTDRDAEL